MLRSKDFKDTQFWLDYYFLLFEGKHITPPLPIRHDAMPTVSGKFQGEPTYKSKWICFFFFIYFFSFSSIGIITVVSWGFYWMSKDNKSTYYLSILFRILTDFNTVVVWMVSILIQISNSSKLSSRWFWDCFMRGNNSCHIFYVILHCTI